MNCTVLRAYLNMPVSALFQTDGIFLIAVLLEALFKF